MYSSNVVGRREIVVNALPRHPCPPLPISPEESATEEVVGDQKQKPVPAPALRLRTSAIQLWSRVTLVQRWPGVWRGDQHSVRERIVLVVDHTGIVVVEERRDPTALRRTNFSKKGEAER